MLDGKRRAHRFESQFQDPELDLAGRACAHASTRVGVGAGETPVGQLERVQAYRRDGRLLLAGERVADDRLPGDNEGGHPTLVDDRLDLAHHPIVAHQPAGVGARGRVFAELLQSWSVA